MSSVASPAELIHLGMDTSKNTIVTAILLPGQEIPAIDRIASDEASVRRLIGRFADRRDRLRVCYEAGPGGYDLYRLLASLGVACDVVAPSLIPKGGSDKVKTDRRDARRLARLHRAGELTAIRVPSPAEEAVRDLTRVRAALVSDRKRAQQRLTAVLMRHGCVWTGSYWTAAHRAWIEAQRFSEPALTAAIAHYRATLATRETELAAIDAELAPWAAREPLAGPVSRLGCYRGIAELGALTLTAEVVDWRRFPAARAFMGYTGLVPAEYSSGDKTRRGHITKAGSEPVRTALIEAAWAYQHAPAIGVTLRRRQAGADPGTLARSWKAQRRLNSRYRHLISHGKAPGEAVTAVARELAGFVWAEMTA